MISVDTKFFSHLIDCLDMQKNIHLKPLKEKILWQDRIDKTVAQCRLLLMDAVEDEKKAIRKKALHVKPDKSIFDEGTIELPDE